MPLATTAVRGIGRVRVDIVGRRDSIDAGVVGGVDPTAGVTPADRIDMSDTAERRDRGGGAVGGGDT